MPTMDVLGEVVVAMEVDSQGSDKNRKRVEPVDEGSAWDYAVLTQNWRALGDGQCKTQLLPYVLLVEQILQNRC
jgi:hypothetical protein